MTQFQREDESVSFDEKAVWEEDKLDRNEIANTFHRIISKQEHPLTICLNGEWGRVKNR